MSPEYIRAEIKYRRECFVAGRIRSGAVTMRTPEGTMLGIVSRGVYRWLAGIVR